MIGRQDDLSAHMTIFHELVGLFSIFKWYYAIKMDLQLLRIDHLRECGESLRVGAAVDKLCRDSS